MTRIEDVIKRDDGMVHEFAHGAGWSAIPKLIITKRMQMIRLEKGEGLERRMDQAGALCREVFSSRIFSAGERWLRRGAFDCWHACRDLMRVALDGDRVVGLAIGDVRTRLRMTFASLKLIVVHPDYRGRKIATQMLTELERAVADHGADRIVVSDGWPLYFFGGVDFRETEAAIFLHRRGYESQEFDFHLDVPLEGNRRLDAPDPPLPRGVTIRRAKAGDRERTLAAIDRMFSRAWWFETTLAFLADEPTCYVAERDGEVVGFSDYDATNYGIFGPIGVHESLRSRKVGAILYRRCLNEMRALGYPYALIPTNLDRLNFYNREGGATIGRMFMRFQKLL